MFNRDDNGNGSNPPPPEQEAQPEMKLPPIHKFHVLRLRPEWTQTSPHAKGELTYVLELLTVLAHKVEMNSPGNVLRFLEFKLDPVEGPSTRIVKTFNGWIDYEEEWPDPPSLIIDPRTIM